jgi:predicted GH43/DUF377 family glycosyl hydrolase
VIKIGGLYRSYYSGYDGKVWRTGLATSTDGLTWTKFAGNPILAPGEGGYGRKNIAANGDAILIGGNVHYYYQGRNEAGVTAIGLATSADGVAFRKFSPGPVIDVGPKGAWDGAAVGDPNVIAHDGAYYLYFLGMNAAGVQRLGVARSVDGAVWEKFAGNPVLDAGAAGTFDENGVGEPAVVFCAPNFYLLYAGRDARERRNLGLAVSRDGVNWRKLTTAGLVPAEMRRAWDSQVICDPSIIRDQHGGLMVYFGGGDAAEPAQNLHGNIGLFYATAGSSRSEFDAGADWGAQNSTEVLIGSFPVESSDGRKFVWVGPEAQITLAKGSRGTLEIAGWAPLALYHERNGLDSFAIAVTAGGSKVGEIRLHYGQDGLIDASFDVSGVPADEDGGITIKLQASSVLAPTGRDRRDVSFVINRIGLK